MALARPVVLGNWKMNGLRADGLALVGVLADKAARLTGTLGVFPPATLLSAVARRLDGSGILVGAQDCHERASGAFTGSISAPMIKDAGAAAVLVGHSERRHGLGESDAAIRGKAAAGLAAGLLVVLCVGETEDDRAAGKTIEVLDRQLTAGWPEGATGENLIVAYEPVWAIGTGRTATTADIAASHAAIGKRVDQLSPRGEPVPILYGGSVKPENAKEIMAVPEVAGVLVGGASLDAAGFWAIYQAGGGA